MHNVTRTPSAGLLGIGDEATLTVHFTRKVINVFAQLTYPFGRRLLTKVDFRSCLNEVL